MGHHLHASKFFECGYKDTVVTENKQQEIKMAKTDLALKCHCSQNFLAPLRMMKYSNLAENIIIRTLLCHLDAVRSKGYVLSQSTTCYITKQCLICLKLCNNSYFSNVKIQL